MTTSRSVLLISAIALILLALIPAVSATYEETLTDSKITSKDYNAAYQGGVITIYSSDFYLNFDAIEKWPDLKVVYVLTPARGLNYQQFKNWTLAKSLEGRPQYVDFIVTDTKENIGNGYLTYNILYDGNKDPVNVQYWVEFNEWNIAGVAGNKKIQMQLNPDSPLKQLDIKYILPVSDVSDDIPITIGAKDRRGMTGYYIVRSEFNWVNKIAINDTHLSLIRNGHYSELTIQKGEDTYYEESYDDRNLFIMPPITWTVTNSIGTVFNGSYPPGDPGADPGDPDDPVRTGTVTMTDHNGTTISGFEVTAVNHYTGEEYTVSTDTDVAVITLPMDQTITMRNPQTGQYEDVPVGYYLFYVEKPGYKMTSEEGVRISVLPLEYSPYHFGDIIVTSEDGYLTGKHQFQIRSRVDYSILQTGTISAKSATTGEWYNTTVDKGIATLIVPYDTSNPYYQYVGNYYVYATSPGYIPSEYATQISVRPDTQSEIRYVLLTPIGGIPEPDNVTLRIQAYSDSWQEIPNAEIHIDGVGGAGWEIWETYTASSAGYTEISVPGNSTYDITVYGEGYYSSSQRIEVGDTDPPLITFILYPTGAPTLTPTTQPTGWVTPPPTTQPTGGIPDEDDDSDGFMMESVRGIANLFGVSFGVGKTILGMLLALGIGTATAKHLRGGAQEFGMGMLGGVVLGVLIGLLPIWVLVLLVLIVGLWIGQRYMSGGDS